MYVLVFSLAVLVIGPLPGFAPLQDDPLPASLPLPNAVVPEVMPETVFVDVPPVFPYERINRYEVWQYVAPDRHGRFRPRVIYSPFGPYYLHNGAPYLYSATRTLDFMSYATD